MARAFAIVAAFLAILSVVAQANSLSKRQTTGKLDCSSCTNFVAGATAVQTSPCSKFFPLATCTAVQKPLFTSCFTIAAAAGGLSAADLQTALTALNTTCTKLAANDTDFAAQYDAATPASQCSNFSSSPVAVQFTNFANVCNAYNAKIGGASSVRGGILGAVAVTVAGVFATLV
ncbi:hypothetical protein HDU93_000181 [Gonapodya sp. JEL0774]|nr:hypothetical protein HDU93_000181 [Gonapodya sp. JEL0774]